MPTKTEPTDAELVGTWDIDPAHSSVEFSARHAMVATVKGRFNSFSGTIQVSEDLEGSKAEVTIAAASIDTGNEDRDKHLRSPDFLDVERFPALTFTSTEVEPGEGDGDYRVYGDLTIGDVTRKVELALTHNGNATDPYGNLRAGLEASMAISRKEWGITWNAALEAGGVLVGDKVKIALDVSAVKRANESSVAA